MLRNLKRSGFKKEDLKTAYTSMILPVFDFTSVVYHSLLNSEQKLKLERLQARALAIITGTCRSYSGNIEDLAITTLDNQRVELINRFLDGVLKHPTFSEKWFPLKEKHAYLTRHEEKYKEYKCKTERGRANPLCFYRRTLNKCEAAPTLSLIHI